MIKGNILSSEDLMSLQAALAAEAHLAEGQFLIAGKSLRY
jgi:hypothetical protein